MPINKLSSWLTKQSENSDSKQAWKDSENILKNTTEKSDDKSLSSDKNFEVRPFGKKPFEKKPYEKKTFEKKSRGKKPFEKKHFDKKIFENKPFDKKPLEKSLSNSWKQNGNILRIIPLWGFEEVWKNSMVIEYWNDIIVIDIGLQFAESEMLWIDYVIPDVSYLENNRDKIKAIIITHGHLDHIWALPHILEKLNFPKIYATKLTNGLCKKRVEEFWILSKCTFVDINHKDIIKLWVFEIKPFRVNHSIPDWIWMRVKTPNWNIVHTWDFKFDFSPADWCQADYSRIAEIWAEWVVAAFVDSTNSWKEWFTMSERVVWENLEKIIIEADWRIIMALFSSLIWRISQIIDFAQKNWRQVFLSWRSLVNNVEIAQNLWYIRSPKWVIKKLSDEVNKLPPEKVIILCTWSQWEDLSALTRISRDDHPIITIKSNDTVVLSASPIIWNERSVYNVIDLLTAKWAKIITNSWMDVHTSGHAAQWELMLMYSLLSPKYLVPIHGELHMRVKHRDLIEQRLGHKKEDMPILFNWSILEINEKWDAKLSSEKVRSDIVMVDWLWVWDIWTVVLKERQMMSESWTLIALYKINRKTKKQVEDPDIISRWFIYVKESKRFVDEIKKVAKDIYDNYIETNKEADIKTLRKQISNWIVRFTDRKIKRIPMIIPVFVYV